MFNSGILDIAIGLIFIYLLLSLVCSAINEIIEAKLKMRARELERGIRELLTEKKDGTVKKESWAVKFYNHPLIFSLFEGDYDPTKVDAKSNRYARRSNLPSYIPSRNFALALMDLVLPANTVGGTSLSGAAGATVSPAKTVGTANASASFTKSGGTANASASPAKSADTADAAAAAATPRPLQPLRDAVSKIANANVKGALLPLIDAAGDDVSNVRKNIEAWYDSTMDRVSGGYKRQVQWIILGLGFAVAVAVNADTITIAKSLYRDAALRNEWAAAAQKYFEANNSPTSANGDGTTSPVERVKKNLDEIAGLGLPMGWQDGDKRPYPPFEWAAWADWLNKFFGWLITAAAISLGAPFWFDLLNKFMIVRSTVRPHEKSPEEPSINR